MSSIDEEVQLIRFAPLVERFRELCNCLDAEQEAVPAKLRVSFRAVLEAFLEELAAVTGSAGPVAVCADALVARLEHLPKLLKTLEKDKVRSDVQHLLADSARWFLSLLIIIHESGRLGGDDAEYLSRSSQWYASHGLRRALADIVRETVGKDGEPLCGDAGRMIALADILIDHAGLGELLGGPKVGGAVQRLFVDRRSRGYLGVHRGGIVEWFVKEPFEELIFWIMLLSAVTRAPLEGEAAALSSLRVRGDLSALAEEAGYRVSAFLALVNPTAEQPEEGVR